MEGAYIHRPLLLPLTSSDVIQVVLLNMNHIENGYDEYSIVVTGLWPVFLIQAVINRPTYPLTHPPDRLMFMYTQDTCVKILFWCR